MRARLVLGAALVIAPFVASSQTPVRGPSDPAEVANFIDGLVTSYLREKHIAGASVAVVRDTTVLLAKGYGWADVQKRTPANASTLFRIGSISKTFTWTAVMQLVEQGKLDLNADVNTYIDFKIPSTFPEPITLTHILTHTPGLEEDSRDLFTEDPAHITPMKDWLPAHMPARVRAPGTYSSYSNWSTALAGYIVERVSGMTFDEYVEKNLLEPLGMAEASSRQPLPSAMLPTMSTGYLWSNGHWEGHKWEIVTGAAPAGSFSVSANDMARWMMAHLQHGTYRGARILADSTSRRMQTRIQGHDPRIPGFAHGFYEQSTHGPRALGHGGDTQWFHSDMILIPELGVGLYISFNTASGGEISFKPFADDVYAHYFGEPPAVVGPVSDPATLQRYAGEYIFNRRSYTTFQKAFSLQGAIKVGADSGYLTAATPFGVMRLVQVDSNLFRDVGGHDLLAFKADAQGRITHGFLGMVPMMTLEKAGALESPSLHMGILGLGLLTILGIVGAAIVRYFGRHGRAPADALTGRGRQMMLLVSFAILAFVGAFAGIASQPEKFLLGNDHGMFKAALILPVVAVLLTILAGVVAWQQWRTGAGSRSTRIRHTLAVVVLLLFAWSLNTWHLLGWKF